MVAESKAKDLVTPYLSTFYSCYKKALAKMNLSMLASGPLNKRTKATFFHNLINNELKEFFPSGNVRIIDEYESLFLLVQEPASDDCLRIRFKKLGTNGLPSNIHTERNQIIQGQTTLLPALEIAYLDVVYTPNETWTDFKSLQVVCFQNKTISYVLPFGNMNLEQISPAPVKITEVEIKIKGANSDSQEKKAV